jgi:acetyltransferase-like isoleucine patch superfamily enzyme
MAKKRFENWKPPTFDERGMTPWNWMCQHPENLRLGRFVDIGAFTYINALHNVIMEDYVQVGSHCSLYSLSTIDEKKGAIVLKKNCRIGTHSVVMPGVTVGENSVVGAFSFVNADIPDNTLAFGVPVKIIRKLTKEEIEKKHEAI